MHNVYLDDDCPELGDLPTYAMLVVFQVLAIVVGTVADNPTVILVGAIVIGVPVTFAQALLRHAWNERRRRQTDTTASGALSNTAYDSPSTRRT
jgi:membrane protein implicated in regulation of membrane protease activity